MNAQLYFKPNVIGLAFATPSDRDAFWAALGEHRIAAERFAERTIRFNPLKIQSVFGALVDIKEPLIRTQQRVPEASRPAEPAKPNNTVKVTEIKPPEPLPPVVTIPVETTTAAPPPTVTAAPETTTAAPPPTVTGAPSTPIPQVASVNQATPAKVDRRSRAYRAAKAAEKNQNP